MIRAEGGGGVVLLDDPPPPALGPKEEPVSDASVKALDWLWG